MDGYPIPYPSLTTFSHNLPLRIKIRFFLDSCQAKKLSKEGKRKDSQKKFLVMTMASRGRGKESEDSQKYTI
jgi:hypothetical protein